ncbi:unnamed protein product [Ranitomeya imitator]|uniref:Uncharacterized protein n=1 Tax=Ranitomeya imitator TaxID=111125 RepID=A0ABN9ME51_9NEOB|nr:unnamed protein product [Ranitomeya imitator]
MKKDAATLTDPVKRALPLYSSKCETIFTARGKQNEGEVNKQIESVLSAIPYKEYVIYVPKINSNMFQKNIQFCLAASPLFFVQQLRVIISNGMTIPRLNSVIILYPECQCHYPVPRVSVSLSCTPVSVSLSCTPSVSVIILYPECQCHYPVPRVSVSLSCTPSVSVIILYPECQCHYPVPRSVSVIILYPDVIILYPECQCHYPVPRVSVSLSCTPSVSVIILYPECQCHYPVPRVSVSLSCTPSVSVIILYPECQCHYPVPRVSVSLSCTPSVSVIILYPPVSVIILYPEYLCLLSVNRMAPVYIQTLKICPDLIQGSLSLIRSGLVNVPQDPPPLSGL